MKLAAKAGLDLDPWQRHVLAGALGERADGKWQCRDVGLIVPRQNGKGSILEAMELAALFLFGDRLILHTAHEMKTAKNHYERMQSLIKGAPFLEQRVRQWRNSNEEISIELHDGAKLRFIARSTGSGRGFSAHRLVLDEAMILSPETMGALLPTLSVAPNPQTWYAGSAGLHTSQQLARLRDRGLSGADRNLAYFEWSAEDDADLDDIEAWTASNPALGLRMDREAIESERASLPEEQFARERLGIWAPEHGEQVIPEADWNGCADPSSTALDPVTFAVDVTPDRKLASIAMAGRRADGLWHVEVVDNRKGTGWVAGRCAELVGRWKPNPRGVVLDPAGPAGSLVPDLEAEGVEAFVTSARDMTQACGRLFDEATGRRMRHLDDPRLNSALGAARKRPLGDAWAWHRRDLTDISPLVAVTLALDAHVKQAAVRKPATFVPRKVR